MVNQSAKYVLKYTNGDFVATDTDSGGYPYPVKDIFQARIWDTSEKALKYITPSDKDISRIVYEVNVNITPINK